MLFKTDTADIKSAASASPIPEWTKIGIIQDFFFFFFSSTVATQSCLVRDIGNVIEFDASELMF